MITISSPSRGSLVDSIETRCSRRSRTAMEKQRVFIDPDYSATRGPRSVTIKRFFRSVKVLQKQKKTVFFFFFVWAVGGLMPERARHVRRLKTTSARKYPNMTVVHRPSSASGSYAGHVYNTFSEVVPAPVRRRRRRFFPGWIFPVSPKPFPFPSHKHTHTHLLNVYTHTNTQS